MAISDLHLSGASSVLGAVNFITTMSNMRGPAMTVDREPQRWMRRHLADRVIEQTLFEGFNGAHSRGQALVLDIHVFNRVQQWDAVRVALQGRLQAPF